MRQYDKEKAREVFAAARLKGANHEEVYQAMRIFYLTEMRSMLLGMPEHTCNVEPWGIEGECRVENLECGCTRFQKVHIWTVCIDEQNRLMMHCIDMIKVKPNAFNEDSDIECDILLCEADVMLLRDICTAIEEQKAGHSLWCDIEVANE